jgi:uncharacterized protein (DUF697 family)
MVDQSTTIGDVKENLKGRTGPEQIIHKHVLWSMGAGIIPFPVFDVAAVAAVQLKMLRDLTREYGQDFSEARSKALLTSLIGGIAPGSLTGSALGGVIKLVPFVGPIIGGITLPIFAGAATYAIGHVFNDHFARGGTLEDFMDSDATREMVRTKFAEGKRVAESIGRKQPSTT